MLAGGLLEIGARLAAGAGHVWDEAVVPSHIGNRVGRELSNTHGQIIVLGAGSGVFLEHVYEELGEDRSVVILESRRRYLAGLRVAFPNAQVIQAAPEDLQHLPLINCKFSSAVICCRSMGRCSERAMAAIMRGAIMHLYRGQSLWMYGYGRIPHYLFKQVNLHGAAAQVVIPGPGSAGASLLRVSSR